MVGAGDPTSTVCRVRTARSILGFVVGVAMRSQLGGGGTATWAAARWWTDGDRTEHFDGHCKQQRAGAKSCVVERWMSLWWWGLER